MARKPTGEPVGRPPKQADKSTFEGCCEVLCTHDELEAIMGMDRTTLYDWVEREYGEDFPTVYKRLSSGGKKSLRRSQLELAKTNAAAAIWCGKMLLGQKEVKEEIDVNALAALGQMLQLLQKQRDPKDPSDSS